jgi:hypothetical protein
MSKDPRVTSAIAHWAPRFISNGVLLADFQEVTAGIERWEDWCAAWCRARRAREPGPRGARPGLSPVGRRAPVARRGVLPLRQVRVRHRRRADAGGAPQGHHLQAAGGAAAATAGAAGRDPLPGRLAGRPAAAAGRREQAAAGDHGARPRLGQGGDGGLRAAVPGARHGHADGRRPGAGRGRVPVPDPRRLRGAGEGHGRLGREAAARSTAPASGCGASAWAATTRRARPRSRSA